jgi:hypothetical protein
MLEGTFVLGTLQLHLPRGKLLLVAFPLEPLDLVSWLAKSREIALVSPRPEKNGETRPNSGTYSQQSPSANYCKSRELYYESLVMSMQIFAL